MRPYAFVSAALLAMAGCSPQRAPGLYDVPAREAWARLRQADIGGLAGVRGCGPALDFAFEAHAPQSLRWIVRAGGGELASFSVRLEPVDANTTRAVVEFPFDPTRTDTIDTVNGEPALRQPLQGAVVELVDAAMNQRGYDASRIGDDRGKEEACARKPGSRQPDGGTMARAQTSPWGTSPVPREPQGAFGIGTEPVARDPSPGGSAATHPRGWEPDVKDAPPPDQQAGAA